MLTTHPHPSAEVEGTFYTYREKVDDVRLGRRGRKKERTITKNEEYQPSLRRLYITHQLSHTTVRNRVYKNVINYISLCHQANKKVLKTKTTPLKLTGKCTYSSKASKFWPQDGTAKRYEIHSACRIKQSSTLQYTSLIRHEARTSYN